MNFCHECGYKLAQIPKFCPRCGKQQVQTVDAVTSGTSASVPIQQTDTVKIKQLPFNQEFKWEIKIKLLFNPIIWKDFAKVWGISIGLLTYLVLIVLIKSENDKEIPMFLEVMGAMFAGFMVLTFLIMLVMFAKGLPTLFSVDSEGIYYKMMSDRASIANKVVVIGGALAGSASTVGAGMLAQSGQEGFFPWASIAKLKRKNNGGAISVYNSWRQVLVMYCKKEDCDTILKLSQAYLDKSLQTDIQDREDYAKMQESTFSGIKTLFWAIFGTGLLFLYPPLSTDEPVGLLIPGVMILLSGFARRYVKIILALIGLLMLVALITLFVFEDASTMTFSDWKYTATAVGFLVLLSTCVVNILAGFKQLKRK